MVLVILLTVIVVTSFLTLLLFDSLFNIKSCCNHVACRIKDFDYSFFTSHDCEIFGVSMELCEFKACDVQSHLRFICVPFRINSNNLLVIKSHENGLVDLVDVSGIKIGAFIGKWN